MVPELDTGGAELTTVEVAEAVVRAGGRAFVATEGGRLAERLIKAGGEIVELATTSKNPVRMVGNANSLLRFCRANSVDIIHARSRAPAWSALSAARRAGIPFVTTYHGAYSENGPIKRTYNSIMARGDVVIANSRYTAELIKSRYGTPGDRVRVINRGVDLERFDRRAVDQRRLDELRQQWRVGPAQKIILHPARLTRWKGQSVVIEAAARLEETSKLDGAVIVFAGDDQGRDHYSRELRERVAELGLANATRFVGHVSDMPAAYAVADVALVASIEPEAFGRTAAEAQALGTPVIATAIGAPQETVLAPPNVDASQSTGRLVAPEDAAALADSIAELLSLTAGEREALAGRARANVERNYSMRELQRATLAVYDELIGSNMARAFDREGTPA